MAILNERRRTAFAPELYVRVGLAWVVICVLLLVTDMQAIAALRYPDPDDIMRLIQVRDLMAGQSWFDVTQHRVDAVSGGVLMHWSRLVDIPLVAATAFLSVFLSGPAAEAAAAVAVPLITFGCAMLLAGRIAWRLVGAEAAGMTCLAMALSVPLISQMRPLRIDHYGWQIVLALLAVNGLMARSPRLGGWVTGFALALWVSISMEGLPLAAVICGLVALRWLRDRRDRFWFVNVMGALATSSVAIFMLTRGFRDFGQHCDAITPVHLAVFVWGGATSWLLARCEPIPRGALMTGLGAIALGGAAILYLAAPQCTAGGFAALDPVVAKFWYQGAGEGLPVWEQSPAMALQIVVPPIIALFATLQLARKSADWLRQWWYDYAVLLLAALAFALFVARAGAMAGALASVPLGWQVSQWIRNARNMRRPAKRALVLAGAALALLPTLPLTLLTIAMPARAALGSVPVKASSCAIPQSAAVLRGLPSGEILAPLDIGPQLLYETDHTVIATGHRRGDAGTRAVIDMFTGTAGAAHSALQARGTAYLVLCPDLVEPARYAGAAPGGFMAQLLRGRDPAWLEPVVVSGNGNMKVWRIRS